MARAMQEAQMRQQGFESAQQTALAQLQAQQGLGTYQSQLGGTQRQINQGQLAADQEAAREAAFADYTQLGLVAPQLASVIGGFPAATQMQSTPPPSTTQQLLGLGIGAAGLGAAIEYCHRIIMSRILRRPMFRGGRVESKDDLKVVDQMGIAKLATGGIELVMMYGGEVEDYMDDY